MDRASKGEVTLPDAILDRATKRFRKLLERRFSAYKGTFRLRMSNLGKPTCQLWFQSLAQEQENIDYATWMKFFTGDIIELVVLTILEGAAVDINAVDKNVTLELDGEKFNGTYDIKIAGEIYDIKSASSVAFDRKFNSPWGFDNLKEKDDFGYLVQGIAYGEADNSKFRGWIAVNKETGQWAVLEIPDAEYETVRQEALETIRKASKVILDGVFPGRCFDDQPEVFRKKVTGNRVLHPTCGRCQFKDKCWPNLQHKPQAMSTAASPAYRWYTHYEDETTEEVHND